MVRKKIYFIFSIFPVLTLIIFSFLCSQVNAPYTAQGAKVGEVTSTSAVVWVRLTISPTRNTDSGDWADTGKPTNRGPDPGFVGECPGSPGMVRMHYGEEKNSKKSTEWASVDESSDFCYQFNIRNLKPAATYFYQVETADITGKQTRLCAAGRFITAPEPDVWDDILFTVITGQAVRSIDRDDGFNTYVSMKNLNPNFLVCTGDNVYYDSDPPIAKIPLVARFHWHRMYSLPTVVSLFETVPVYFEKDDHDYRWNDSDPHRDFPGISHKDGVTIFKEQVPMSDKTYRTFRWGEGLQIWLVEGRDYRSPNTMPDGPEKSIWGREQKLWLKEGIKNSNALFKVLISPTPIVGPDRQTKIDNHANQRGFWTEGREFLKWVKENAGGNFFIVCGDRHWQYHSIDETGIMEFSSGSISDKHAEGISESPKSAPRWPPDKQPYYRINIGGFLSVKVSKIDNKHTITFRHHDVFGKILYQWQKSVIEE